MPGERILVVDDEPGVRTALAGILRDEGFEVATAGSGEDGLAALADRQFDAVLLDVWLPGKDGLETLVELRERRVDAVVVMISGHATIETAVRATRLGAFDFIEKPLSLERTLLVLRNALRQRHLEARNRRLLEQLERDTEILGTSSAADRIRVGIAAASASDAPVLLVGEPGSERERVARRIHAGSHREDEAFVGVPCAALDPAGSGEALFGTATAPGRIGLAARGTLFLDDVHELEPQVQSRLAAFFASTDAVRADVRLLAGIDPAGAALSPALARVLEVLRVDIAPLRERRTDVPLLAQRLLHDLCTEYGRPRKRLAPEALRALVEHDWPGNLRELRHVIERLVLVSPGEVIDLRELPAPLGEFRSVSEDLYRDFGSLGEGVETFERYWIRRVVSEAAGDRQRAAARLAISVDALATRMT